MIREKHKIATERPLEGWPWTQSGGRGIGLQRLLALGLALLVGGTGCDRSGRDENGVETKEDKHEIAYDAAAPREIDVSGISDAPTEDNALKAYFKGKKLLSMAYFAKSEARSKQYSAEAERWFERSLRFYVPDIEAMVDGKKPVHGSANWEFLKGLHEAWSESIKLSEKRLASKEYVDKNAKDAWALSVISRMIQNEENEGKRRKLIEGKFPEIREILDGNDKYAAQLAAKKDALGKRRAQSTQGGSSKAGKEQSATHSMSKPSISMLAGTEAPGATASPSQIEKKKDNTPATPPMLGGETPRMDFKPLASSPAKIYVGGRLYTLPPAPGKLYIGGRIYTLPPKDSSPFSLKK